MAKLKPSKKRDRGMSPALAAALDLHRQGRLDEAEGGYRAVLREDPKDWRGWHQLGMIHLARGRYAEALQCIGAAMKANPASAEAASNYGGVLRCLKRDDEAIAYFDRALILRPGYVPALVTRGASLHRLGRREEALKSIDRAIELEPANATAHYNRANILHDLKRFDEALQSFARSSALDPDSADTHWNEALARLLIGDYREGWKKYEWRWKAKQKTQVRDFRQPLWLGETPLAGKTILIHAEQGYGDTIQFVRYIPILAAMGAKIVLEVQSALKTLMASLEGVSTLLARGETLPPFDVHCPVVSLPLAFKTELSTIPASVPYLQAPTAHIEKWRGRIRQGKKLSIAFAWTGSPGNEENDIRSIPIEEFTPLFADKDIQWLSVQHNISPHDSEFLNSHPVAQLGAELSDFSDTAAVVSQADLVISVCTSVAHLAGALNRPFWLLSKHSPDFRWLLDRDDSPWYPSARIFSQPDFGDWASVIARVRAELTSFSR